MADEWYYAKGGEKTGPVSHAELLELVRSGGLDRTDVVWAVGMTKWAEAGSVEGLFPPMSEPPPLTGGSTTPTPTAHPPGGLMPAVVGMFVVSGLDLLLGLLGVLQADEPVVRVLLALGVAHNAAAVALTFAVTRLRNYRLAFAAPWVVMTCWVWHWLSNVTHGMTLLGMALAVSAGAWGFVVIRGRAVRRAFEAEPPLPPLFGWHTVASLFDTTDAVRRLNLAGKWEPTQEGEPGLEFTHEGAVIRGDGRAGKYTLGGDRLVIQIEGVPGDTLELVKLTSRELVLGSGGRVRSYRKREEPGLLASIFGSGASTTADQRPPTAQSGEGQPASSEPAGGQKPGLWHRLRSAFNPRTDECPHCHENLAGEKTGEEPIGHHEEAGRMVLRETIQERTGSWTAPIHQREILREVPAVVVVETFWKLLRCKFCGHAWKAKHRRELGKRPL